MTVIADKVPQILENLALLNPFRSIKHNRRINLALLFWLDHLKCKTCDSLILQDCFLKSDLNVGNMQILISDVDNLVDAVMRVFALTVLHGQNEDEPS